MARNPEESNVICFRCRLPVSAFGHLGCVDAEELRKLAGQPLPQMGPAEVIAARLQRSGDLTGTGGPVGGLAEDQIDDD